MERPPSLRECFDPENPWVWQFVLRARAEALFVLLAIAALIIAAVRVEVFRRGQGYSWRYMILPWLDISASYLSYALAPFIGKLAWDALVGHRHFLEAQATLLRPRDHLAAISGNIYRWCGFILVLGFFLVLLNLRIGRPFRWLTFAGAATRIQQEGIILLTLHLLAIVTILNQAAGFYFRASLLAFTKLREFPFFLGAIAVVLGRLYFTLSLSYILYYYFDLRALLRGGQEQHLALVGILLAMHATFFGINLIGGVLCWRHGLRRFPQDAERLAEQTG